MKKDLFKRLINDFWDRDLADVKEWRLDVPIALNQVISLIGVQRSGKTNLLYGLARRLSKEIDQRRIVYRNLWDRNRQISMNYGNTQRGNQQPKSRGPTK